MRNRANASILSAVAAWALIAIPALVLTVTRPAAADTGNAAIDRGIALYDDLEFEAAIVALADAVKQKNLTRAELVEAYKYLALAHVAMNQDDQAKDAFHKLLEVNPAYNLPRTESPRALDLFDEVKSVVAPRDVVRLTQTASPARPRSGQPITVSAAVVDEMNKLDHVTVYHRVRGQKTYSSVIALPIGSGRYNATISGSLVSGAAIEYYVTAEDTENNALASEGSDTEPMVLVVDKEDESKPIYGRWWFWAGLGTVLLAGAAVGLVLAGGDGVPSDDGVDVTITVNGP